MTCLFIGGNADGEEIEVDEGVPVWRVADKNVSSLSGTEYGFECRRFSTYTKRTYRRGSWLIVYYFAVEGMSDREALDRFIELQR